MNVVLSQIGKLYRLAGLPLAPSGRLSSGQSTKYRVVREFSMVRSDLHNSNTKICLARLQAFSQWDSPVRGTSPTYSGVSSGSPTTRSPMSTRSASLPTWTTSTMTPSLSTSDDGSDSASASVSDNTQRHRGNLHHPPQLGREEAVHQAGAPFRLRLTLRCPTRMSTNDAETEEAFTAFGKMASSDGHKGNKHLGYTTDDLEIVKLFTEVRNRLISPLAALRRGLSKSFYQMVVSFQTCVKLYGTTRVICCPLISPIHQLL